MILAIDTSLGTSIALVDGDRVVAEHHEHDTRRHAEVLDVALAAVLRGHADAVTQVVAGLGPGAFTGLRIGIVAARTVALGLGVPWVGVCSHDAVGVGRPGLVQVTTDVRRRERAWSVYDGGRRVQGPALAPAADVPIVDGAERVDADWVDASGLVAALHADAVTSRDAIYLRDADAVPCGRSEAGDVVIALRTATPGDLDAIMAIEQASFGLTAWARDTMAAEMASEWGRYVVAVDDDAIVGYVGLRAVGVEGDIQTIAVAEAARGTGLGRRLLRQAQQDARERGVTELFLEVREDNPAARALYASEGFVEIGVRPGYYQPEGVDAIAMRKELA